MRLTRSSDYGLRAMIYLAGLEQGQAASGAVIAQAVGVGEPFLLKVMRMLVRSRLVRAQPGVGGGFRLAVPAEQVSMLRVIEAVDGPLENGSCLVEDDVCSRRAWCSVHTVMAELHRNALKLLGGTSIDHLRRDAAARQEFIHIASERPA